MAKNLITTKDLMAAFNVSHPTVTAWRAGSVTRAPLPVVDTGSRQVRFKASEVTRWAKAHSVMVVNPEALLNGAGVGKPGPKRMIPATAAARHFRAYR